MTLRDLVSGLAYRADGVAAWVLGTKRKAQLDLWFADKYLHQPLTFYFSVTWLLFVAVPIATFLGYLLFWGLFAFGLFWAVLLFWAGLGLVLLVPALFLASALAIGAFLWVTATLAITARALALLGYQLPTLSAAPAATVKVESTPRATRSDYTK